MKSLVVFLGFCSIGLIVSGCGNHKGKEEVSQIIDIYEDPCQEPFDGETLTVRCGTEEFQILPVARYALSGVVVGKKKYSSSWEACLAPFDVAFVWGKLAESEAKRFVRYWQNNRWYYWQYTPESPFQNEDIITHSSNNHTIPANESVYRAMCAARINQKMRIEGYLVNIKGFQGENPVWWNTSLSRSDTGMGSCEIIYVKRVQIDNLLYE